MSKEKANGNYSKDMDRGPNSCSQIDRARLEELLAECHLPSEVDEEDETRYEAEEVNPEEAVEIARLPVKAKEVEQALPQDPPPAPPTLVAPAPEAKPVLGTVVKLALLVLALAAALSVGILAGRGHIWKAGPGQSLVSFIEQNTGFVPKPKPAPKEKPAGQEQADKSLSYEGAEGQAPAATSEGANDEMPVWDWEAWNSDDTESLFIEDAAPKPGAEQAGQPSQAETENIESSPAEEWPTAIEPDQSGLYIPPSDQEPDEIGHDGAGLDKVQEPDTITAESSFLPPAELSGKPSLGKFMVQVWMANNKKEAANKVATLQEQGFISAYFVESAQDAFPVRVGHFATRQEADAVKVSLEDMGYEDPAVSSLNKTNGG